MKRTTLKKTLIAGLVTSFVGAAAAVDREDMVIFDLDRTIKDPTNFNWMTPGTKRLHGAHQAMWEPLFILSYGTGELQPWLGTSFEPNASFDRWTLTLRKGVEWSDGEAFDADDVTFTIDMVLNNEEISAREAATIRAQVASVEKLGSHSVQFNLKQPNPRFAVENFGVRIFGSFLIMPEHKWSGQDAATFAFNPPIGTGPYTLNSADTNRAVWDLNENWWGAKTGFMDLPAPKRLMWLESGTEENRAQLIATNQIDAAQSVGMGTLEAIRAQNPNVIAWTDGLPYAWPDPCARQLEINATVAPWDDANMRQAVAHIIDREQIVNIAYECGTAASRSMFVQYGSMAPFVDAIVASGNGLSSTANLAEAHRLIKAAGYSEGSDGFYTKGGEALSVDVHVNSASSEYTRTIDVVVEQLNRAGIKAKAVPVENGVFWGEVLPLGKYEMSYSWLSCGSVNEPWTSMNRYTNNAMAPVGERAPGFNNTGRWDTDATSAYTAIVNKMADMSPTDPAIPGMVADAYQYLADEMPFIPLVQAAKILPFNTTYWTGWPTADNNYNHPAHWWNHTHQIIHNLEKAQ